MGACYAYRVRVIARRTLREFAQSLSGRQESGAVAAALDAWFHEVSRSVWHNSAQVNQSYSTASIVSADRVVFNIKGNAYRLVAAVDYDREIVWVKWIGRHSDYDRIDVRTVEYGE